MQLNNSQFNTFLYNLKWNLVLVYILLYIILKFQCKCTGCYQKKRKGLSGLFKIYSSTFSMVAEPCKSLGMEMVFCYQNFSDLLWEKNDLVIEKILLKLEAEGWSFKITRTIFSNSKMSEQVLVKECFFNLFLEVSQI